METVQMFHPNLDDGNRIVTVPESAVPEHRVAGWQVADAEHVVDAELRALKAREAELLEQQKARKAESFDEGGELVKPAKKTAKKSSN